jgi:hypothetical protein
VRSEYTETISDNVDKGYVKKLSKDKADQLRQQFHWFLPHFIIVHPDKPNYPCRVLDCAAKVCGTVSLLAQQHAERWSQEHGVNAGQASAFL